MNSKQFTVLTILLRMRSDTRTAARAVIIDGATQADAAREMGMSPQSVGAAVRRLKTSHMMVKDAYQPGKVAK